jgi:hypothetical protein
MPGESNEVAGSSREPSSDSLEVRRVALELGAGGDHDVPYEFDLPLSMPLALAWVRMQTKVLRGELQP